MIVTALLMTGENVLFEVVVLAQEGDTGGRITQLKVKANKYCLKIICMVELLYPVNI